MSWILVWVFVSFTDFSGHYRVLATGSARFDSQAACKEAKLSFQEQYGINVQLMCLPSSLPEEGIKTQK